METVNLLSQQKSNFDHESGAGKKRQASKLCSLGLVSFVFVLLCFSVGRSQTAEIDRSVNLKTQMLDLKIEQEKQELQHLRLKSVKALPKAVKKDNDDPLVYGVEYQPINPLPDFDVGGYESYQETDLENEIQQKIVVDGKTRIQLQHEQVEFVNAYIKNLQAQGYKVRLTPGLILEIETPRSKKAHLQ